MRISDWSSDVCSSDLPLGPLCIRWRHLPGLAPWLGRFALAALPRNVERTTAALAGLLRGAIEAWREELASSGAEDLFRQHGALPVSETDRAFRAIGTESCRDSVGQQV